MIHLRVILLIIATCHLDVKTDLILYLKTNGTLQALYSTCSTIWSASGVKLVLWPVGVLSCFNSEKWRLLIRKSLQRGSLSFLQPTQQVFVSLLPSLCSSVHSLMDYCRPPAAMICEGHVMSGFFFYMISRTTSLCSYIYTWGRRRGNTASQGVQLLFNLTGWTVINKGFKG